VKLNSGKRFNRRTFAKPLKRDQTSKVLKTFEVSHTLALVFAKVLNRKERQDLRKGRKVCESPIINEFDVLLLLPIFSLKQ